MYISTYARLKEQFEANYRGTKQQQQQQQTQQGADLRCFGTLEQPAVDLDAIQGWHVHILVRYPLLQRVAVPCQTNKKGCWVLTKKKVSKHAVCVYCSRLYHASDIHPSIHACCKHGVEAGTDSRQYTTLHCTLSTARHKTACPRLVLASTPKPSLLIRKAVQGNMLNTNIYERPRETQVHRSSFSTG